MWHVHEGLFHLPVVDMVDITLTLACIYIYMYITLGNILPGTQQHRAASCKERGRYLHVHRPVGAESRAGQTLVKTMILIIFLITHKILNIIISSTEIK